MKWALILVLTFYGCVLPQASVKDGVVLLREGKISQAKQVFLDNLADHESPEAYDGLGCVAYYQGDFSTAEENFLRAKELDSSYNSAIENLAFLYDEIGEKEKAEKLYIELGEDQRSFRALNNYADYLYSEGREAEARSKLKLAYKISRDQTVRRNLRYEKSN